MTTGEEAGGAWARAEGLPLPLGVTWIPAERAYNFALYSKHAERVTLLLYAGSDLSRPAFTFEFDHLRHKSGRVWHCRLPAAVVHGARYYAYSIDGPAPAGVHEWHAFDGEKILLDPYARAVFVPPAFEPRLAASAGSNAGRAPLGLLDADGDDFDWSGDRHPRHESDLVIYELHVRGFTRNPNSGVAAGRRGTYAGLADRIPYLRELGITAVELMPVSQHEPGADDYWGYMPLAFLAADAAYAAAGAEGARTEFREMVRAFHDAGIEVIVDAVYNHTAERGAGGPTYSLKGIDNSTYYLMEQRMGGAGDAVAAYADYSGTGNTLNCANRAVRRLILDSMHHWVEEMHVDGFRFDLASIFTRRADGSPEFEDPPVVGDIRSHDEFERVRLIAEPWDAGGAYQLGRAFPGRPWQQWNGQFRDDVRRFVRGDRGLVPALIRRLYGSDDLFPDDRMNAYHPWQSVNYVTCHDGFTLHDLVSYDHRRNWANGLGNGDGPARNLSWNCGWEGDEDVPGDVALLRRRQARNLLCLLLLANGTPMLRAGDEFLQTQGGNSNPYNQDNETSWLDWSRLDDNRDLFRFVRHLIAFRKAHRSIARSRFWREDVTWYGATSGVDLSADSRSLAYSLNGASEDDDDLYVMVNAGAEPLRFTIQDGGPARWRRVIDTSLPSPDDISAPGDEVPVTSATRDVGSRSIVVLVRPRV